MQKYAFTLVIDAGSILGLFGWIVLALVIIGVVGFILYLIAMLLGGTADVTGKVAETVNTKSKKNLRIGEVLLYSFIYFIISLAVCMLIIIKLPSLWFIGVLIFFSSFLSWLYFGNRIDAQHYADKRKQKSKNDN